MVKRCSCSSERLFVALPNQPTPITLRPWNGNNQRLLDAVFPSPLKPLGVVGLVEEYVVKGLCGLVGMPERRPSLKLTFMHKPCDLPLRRACHPNNPYASGRLS